MPRRISSKRQCGRSTRLAGIGPDRTLLEIWADPSIDRNCHTIEINSDSPVCVIPMGRVDDGIAMAHEDGVIFTCFGDMMRVPGSDGTLLEAKADGADVRMVYSPLDALRIAKREPRPRGRLLRDRVRDDRALDGADPEARQGRGRHRTSSACATT